ncbi:hypothetical protein [Streptomyces sp. NPDC005046]
MPPGTIPTRPDAPERRTILDRVVSSYTPTVRALRYARQRTPALLSPARALIVAKTPSLWVLR